MMTHLTVILIATLISSAAYGHSFYPVACCSDRDCWPMGTDLDAKEPDPRVVPGGYMTHDGIFVAEANTRPSKDGRFHICRNYGMLSGKIVSPAGQALCLFVPKGSS